MGERKEEDAKGTGREDGEGLVRIVLARGDIENIGEREKKGKDWLG